MTDTDRAEWTVLAIDAGTTGVTAIAFDQGLTPVARAYAEFPQHFPNPGWVEHRASEILRAVDEVTGEVLKALDRMPVAVGITNQRETVFALDRREGEALAPGIVWQDRRTAQRCEALKEQGLGPMIGARTGLVLDPYFSGTKIEWLLQHGAGVQAAAQKGRCVFATVDALIVHHLTGGETLATDPTNASRTMLFDIDRREYADELLALFGIRREALAQVLPSAGSFGIARFQSGGATVSIPITGVLGDQQAALFGQGCVAPGELKTTYGTGCFLLLNTGASRANSGAGLLTTLAADEKGGAAYALEGSAFAGGSIIQWMRDELGILHSARDSEAMARSVPDTGGVVLVPAFSGLGAPYWDADARAALFGMTRGTGAAHIVRAGLDAIAHQCTDLVEALRADSGLPVHTVRVDGGAAANGYLMQRQADLAGVVIERPGEVEATARGAAAIAALGAQLMDAAAIRAALAQECDSFRPGEPGGPKALELERARWHDAVNRTRSGPLRG